MRVGRGSEGGMKEVGWRAVRCRGRKWDGRDIRAGSVRASDALEVLAGESCLSFNDVTCHTVSTHTHCSPCQPLLKSFVCMTFPFLMASSLALVPSPPRGHSALLPLS